MKTQEKNPKVRSVNMGYIRDYRYLRTWSIHDPLDGLYSKLGILLMYTYAAVLLILTLQLLWDSLVCMGRYPGV